VIELIPFKKWHQYDAICPIVRQGKKQKPSLWGAAFQDAE
jgi:hypothetical protein